MNILILGATSRLGQAVAEQFYSDNTLFLSGRNERALTELQQRLESQGSSSCSILVHDLAGNCNAMIDKLPGTVDLVINAASASSELRDSGIPVEAFEEIVQADLLAPLRLIEKLLKRQSTPVHTVFISSVLSDVMTQDRKIYASLKMLQELMLEKLQTAFAGQLSVSTIKIGTWLDRERITEKHREIAELISQNIGQPCSIQYGNAGKVLRTAWRISPIAMEGMVKVTRLLRGNRT
jgi:short-subunit dehydrogenase